MKLEELLEIKLKSLYKKYNKTDKILNSNKARSQQATDNLELLNLFLENSVYIENIRNMDTSHITDLLKEYHYIDDNNIEQELNIIKLLLKGIYDRNLKTSLSENQKETLNSYIDSVMKLVNILNEEKSTLIEERKSVKDEHDRLEEEILRIEILKEKILNIKDESLLDMEDVETVKLISEDKSIDANLRKEILIKFIEYNNDRKEGKSKDNKVKVEDVISIFKQFNKNILSALNKFKYEVLTNANIENIKSILTFLKSVNIIDRFENVSLLGICLFGTLDSVKDKYEEISREEEDSIYYSVFSVWVNNTQNKRTKKKKYKGHEIKNKTNVSLSSAAHLISKEELDRNIKYLKREGFVFDLNGIGSKKALTTPNYKLQETVNALKTYGIVTPENISDFKIWLLAEPQIVEKIDKFVELGLLSGYNAKDEYANYLKRFPGKLHNTEYVSYILYYKAKQTFPNDSYYELISSEKRGKLSGNINNGTLGEVLDTPEKIENFEKENFVNYESVIKNFSFYEDKIDSSFNVEIDRNIFYLDEIQNLEENYTVQNNPFVYVFDGLIISRLKVLRNYSLIHDGTKESLMASIVKGSYLTQESLLKVAKSIGFVLGGNDELSKKI